MTLCSSMTDKSGKEYRMSGVFDAKAEFVDKRHGPTYVLAEAKGNNPLFSGPMRGHEYHYSEVLAHEDAEFCFDIRRGLGIRDGKDGLVRNNAVGTYMHQHALSCDDWAEGFVESAC